MWMVQVIAKRDESRGSLTVHCCPDGDSCCALCATVDVLMPDETLVHVSMSTCGSQPAICALPLPPPASALPRIICSTAAGQLKYWVDFH